MIYPRQQTEADAVVAEAHALEEETKLYTAAFQAAPVEEGPSEAEGDARLYRGLLDAAGCIVEISYGVQNPLQDNPYQTLGAEIIGPAKAVLAAIEDFGDDAVSPACEARRLGGTSSAYEALTSAAERLVELCYRAQDPICTSPYAPLGAEIAEPAMAIYQTVKNFTPPALPKDR